MFRTDVALPSTRVQADAVQRRLEVAKLLFDGGPAYPSGDVEVRGVGRRGVCGNGWCETGESLAGVDGGASSATGRWVVRSAAGEAACRADCPREPLGCPSSPENGDGGGPKALGSSLLLHQMSVAPEACRGQGACVAALGICECHRGYTGVACERCAAGHYRVAASGPCVPLTVLTQVETAGAQRGAAGADEGFPLWTIILTIVLGFLVVLVVAGGAALFIWRQQRARGQGGSSRPSAATGDSSHQVCQSATGGERRVTGSNRSSSARQNFNVIFAVPDVSLPPKGAGVTRGTAGTGEPALASTSLFPPAAGVAARLGPPGIGAGDKGWGETSAKVQAVHDPSAPVEAVTVHTASASYPLPLSTDSAYVTSSQFRAGETQPTARASLGSFLAAAARAFKPSPAPSPALKTKGPKEEVRPDGGSGMTLAEAAARLMSPPPVPICQQASVAAFPSIPFPTAARSHATFASADAVPDALASALRRRTSEAPNPDTDELFWSVPSPPPGHSPEHSWTRPAAKPLDLVSQSMEVLALERGVDEARSARRKTNYAESEAGAKSSRV